MIRRTFAGVVERVVSIAEEVDWVSIDMLADHHRNQNPSYSVMAEKPGDLARLALLKVHVGEVR